MPDRSDEVRAKFQAQLDAHDDPATMKIKAHEDGNEEFYQIYLHHAMNDRFVEWHIFVNFDEPIEIPSYEEFYK